MRCKTNIVFWKKYKDKEYNIDNMLIWYYPHPTYLGFSIPKRKQNFIIDIFIVSSPCEHEKTESKTLFVYCNSIRAITEMGVKILM